MVGLFIIIAVMVVVPDQIQEVDAWQSNNVNLDVDEGCWIF
ncbi:hypothetical protein [Thomasclavelia cocleata]|nr:hypothetical protein [Thomasclavelia cocleata]